MKKLIAIILALMTCAVLLLSAGCAKEQGADDKTGSEDVNDKEEKTEDTDNSYEVKLGDYIGIEYVPVVADEITEEDVDEYIENILANYYSTKQEVTDRPLKEGDTVNLDYVGKIDGVEFEGGSYSGYDLTIGSNKFIDGFEDGLIGAKIGEVRDVTCTFPKDYGSADLAGKTAVFTCTINSITETVIPEFTDEYVKENITGYDNVKSYRAYIKNYLEEQEKENTLKENNTGITALAVEACEVTKYPQVSLDEMIDGYLKTYSNYATSYGYSTVEEYFEANGYKYDDMYEYIEDYCKSFIKNNIVFYEIAKKEGITVSEEEIEKAKKEYLENWGYDSEDDLTYNLGYTFDEYYEANVSRYSGFTLEYELTVSAAQKFVIDKAIAVEKKD